MGIVCPDIVGECQPYLLVENVVVSSVYQGSGIGKKLMNALEDFAMENLCSYIILASSKIVNKPIDFMNQLDMRVLSVDLLNESDLLNIKVLSAISKMVRTSDNNVFTYQSPEVEAGSILRDNPALAKSSTQ